MEKYHKKISIDELCELIIHKLTTIGAELEFAVEGPSDEDGVDDVMSNDLTGFYFVRRMAITECESYFLLIDYVGGEEAYAIPLHSYSNTDFDEDDKRILAVKLHRYFSEMDEVTLSVWVVDED